MTLDPAVVEREDRAQPEHDADRGRGDAEPPAPAQVVERVDQEPDARRPGDRAARARRPRRRRAAAARRVPRACHQARAAATGPVTGGAGSARRRRPTEKRAASSTANPSAMRDRAGVDDVHGHGRRLRRELGGSDGARQLAGQVDRDDLARTGRPRRARTPRRTRRAAAATSTPCAPAVSAASRSPGVRSTPSTCRTPSTTTSSGTTPMPHRSAAPSGSDAVESVTIATDGCSTWRRPGMRVRPARR